MARLAQVSLTGGEVSPSLFARVDLARYQTSLRTCRNFFVRPTGGVSNRAGTQFVAELSAASDAVLVPFIFKADQAYMLAFQEETVQVFANGGFVYTQPGVDITNITDGLVGLNPRRTITTDAAHGLNVSDDAVITGVQATGTYAINGTWPVLEVPGATSFRIEGSGDPMGAYISGGAVGAFLTVATPYQNDDLTSIRFTQSNDILTVVNPAYMPHEFRRLAAESFEFEEIEDFVNGPFLPENTTATTMQASAATGSITITASAATFNADHIGALIRLDETDFSTVDPWEASKLLAANTVNPNGLLRRANGKVYQCVTNEAAGTDGTYTGTVRPSHDEGTQSDGDGNPIANLATRAGVDWMYLHGAFGIARITAFTDSTHVTATVLARMPASVVSGTTDTWALGAWSEDQGYPSVVTYYQDRLVLAATPEQPQTEWASKTGDYHNFGVSTPIVEDDAISQTLNARQVNEIRELVPLDQLIALTAASAWASPKRGEAWTPETIGFDPQAYDGAADLRAILVGDTALYAENYGTRIRDLRYQFDIDKFSGSELTVLARHLFGPAKSIVDMDYAREPHGILWSVRSDGVLVGTTYLREQDVVGLHRHDTRGLFKRVCVIPEEGRDAVYLTVARTINGVDKLFLERLADREIEDPADGVFLDCSLSFDGRNDGATTLTLTGATYTAGSVLSCSASSAAFITALPPDEITLRNGDDYVRCTVTGISSTSLLTCVPVADVPQSLRGHATTDWARLFDTFRQLEHLEGESVTALGDGAVFTGFTVDHGSVTLPHPVAVAHIGLPFTADVETLDINEFGRENTRDRAKTVAKVHALVQDTIGLKAGRDADHLEDMAEREDQNYDDPIQPLSGIARYYTPSNWGENGRVLFRQDQPLPATILAIMPTVTYGGDSAAR